MDQTNLLKTPEKSQVISGRRGRALKSSFTDYVENNMAADRRRNLLQSREGQVRAAVESKQIEIRRQREKVSETTALADKLNEGIKRLREYADNTDADGEWSLPVADLDLLKKLATDAGMSPAETNQILEQARGNSNQIGLINLFDSLSRHLESMRTAPLVSVPETDLPLLETFLARMGVSVDEINRVSDSSIAGDGRLDLKKFLEGLEAIQGNDATTLTDWEAEQLQNILAKAGVSENLQSSLLLEKDSASRQWNDVPVTLGLVRLKSMLAQRINDIEASRLQPDGPAFVDDLEMLLSQAGLQDNKNWSPAVQNSVLSAFRELLQTVDLSTMHATQAENTLFTEFLWKQALASSDGGPDSMAAVQGRFSLQSVATALEQQILEQVSRSVIRGLQHNEHNLVLKLHPSELGEVKVHLTVRDAHVSAAFSMENARVKELLENNMQQFQDNLQDKGFTLGQFSVSVSHRHLAQDSSDSELQNQGGFDDLEIASLGRQTEVVLPGAILCRDDDGLINLMV